MGLLLVVLVALATSCQGVRLMFNFSGSLTVSGISAGGFTAAQYHVAFSSEVQGAAIFAGGPYYCARGQVAVALTECTRYPLLIDVNSLVSDATTFANRGDIDALSGLKNDAVFLFSGLADTVVKQDVVKKTAEFYQRFGAVVTTEFSIDAEHCQPTIDFGNECLRLDVPYISRCQYDGAGQAFAALFGSSLKPRSAAVPTNLAKIRQDKYFPGLTVAGLSDTAYVYVPTACQNGAKCAIHVSFHGCNQELTNIGTVYVQKSGYLPWAEANNVIVLFPQAAKADFHDNPEACFDWWGYVDSSYAYKTSKQMTTVRNMVKAIQSTRGPTMELLPFEPIAPKQH